MGNTYKRLIADVPTADMIVSALLDIKRARIWNKRPIEKIEQKFKEKGIGTSNEAERIINYLLADRVIVKDGKKYIWNGEVSKWNDADYRRKYALEMLSGSHEELPKIIRKPGRESRSIFQQATYEYNDKTGEFNEVPQEESPKIVMEQYDFTEHSDDELSAMMFAIQKELDARATKREAQAKLQTVLELAEMSKEELLDLLNII